MERLTDNQVPEREQNKIPAECVNNLKQELAQARNERIERSKPLLGHARSMLTDPQVGILAVVNDRGYLVPIVTAADLLREFKAIWRATRE